MASPVWGSASSEIGGRPVELHVSFIEVIRQALRNALRRPVARGPWRHQLPINGLKPVKTYTIEVHAIGGSNGATRPAA
jgi:hypothetical protein